MSRLQKWTKEAAQQYLDEILLLSKKDMQNLFPGCSLWEEKFLGMTKSFVAHNFK
ncbi:hypothetical protein ADICYQ_5964 [Cyclobacterium qasimii M12-11B]|uniref:Uncharacterized protein n=1 Tax=Cyclobacterium qasimii M12-11B TaxID=641524 RepID=S7V4N6_9BACT|nr:hypothetical protein ADICYQ_5964 [Cyclobacterium qasimii M12-11B]